MKRVPATEGLAIDLVKASRRPARKAAHNALGALARGPLGTHQQVSA